MSSSLARRREWQKQRARARQRNRYLRAGIFGAIVLAVVAAIAFFLSPVFAPRASGIRESANGKVINIQAGMDGFDLKEIHVKAGETLTVNFQSLDNEHHTDGGGKHQFAIDELRVNVVAQPLSSSSATFTVTKPGTYTFYCDICCGGKANPTMNGKLIVDPAAET
jgi:heme/copper-type cytochrome/quinol oxidase subunit 2